MSIVVAVAHHPLLPTTSMSSAYSKPQEEQVFALNSLAQSPSRFPPRQIRRKQCSVDIDVNNLARKSRLHSIPRHKIRKSAKVVVTDMRTTTNNNNEALDLGVPKKPQHTTTSEENAFKNTAVDDAHTMSYPAKPYDVQQVQEYMKRKRAEQYDQLAAIRDINKPLYAFELESKMNQESQKQKIRVYETDPEIKRYMTEKKKMERMKKQQKILEKSAKQDALKERLRQLEQVGISQRQATQKTFEYSGPSASPLKVTTAPIVVENHMEVHVVKSKPFNTVIDKSISTIMKPATSTLSPFSSPIKTISSSLPMTNLAIKEKVARERSLRVATTNAFAPILSVLDNIINTEERLEISYASSSVNAVHGQSSFTEIRNVSAKRPKNISQHASRTHRLSKNSSRYMYRDADSERETYFTKGHPILQEGSKHFNENLLPLFHHHTSESTISQIEPVSKNRTMNGMAMSFDLHSTPSAPSTRPLTASPASRSLSGAAATINHFSTSSLSSACESSQHDVKDRPALINTHLIEQSLYGIIDNYALSDTINDFPQSNPNVVTEIPSMFKARRCGEEVSVINILARKKHNALLKLRAPSKYQIPESSRPLYLPVPVVNDALIVPVDSSIQIEQPSTLLGNPPTSTSTMSIPQLDGGNNKMVKGLIKEPSRDTTSLSDMNTYSYEQSSSQAQTATPSSGSLTPIKFSLPTGSLYTNARHEQLSPRSLAKRLLAETEYLSAVHQADLHAQSVMNTHQRTAALEQQTQGFTNTTSAAESRQSGSMSYLPNPILSEPYVYSKSTSSDSTPKRHRDYSSQSTSTSERPKISRNDACVQTSFVITSTNATPIVDTTKEKTKNIDKACQTESTLQPEPNKSIGQPRAQSAESLRVRELEQLLQDLHSTMQKQFQLYMEQMHGPKMPGLVELLQHQDSKMNNQLLASVQRLEQKMDELDCQQTALATQQREQIVEQRNRPQNRPTLPIPELLNETIGPLTGLTYSQQQYDENHSKHSSFAAASDQYRSSSSASALSALTASMVSTQAQIIRAMNNTNLGPRIWSVDDSGRKRDVPELVQSASSLATSFSHSDMPSVADICREKSVLSVEDEISASSSVSSYPAQIADQGIKKIDELQRNLQSNRSVTTDSSPLQRSIASLISLRQEKSVESVLSVKINNTTSSQVSSQAQSLQTMTANEEVSSSTSSVSACEHIPSAYSSTDKSAETSFSAAYSLEFDGPATTSQASYRSSPPEYIATYAHGQTTSATNSQEALSTLSVSISADDVQEHISQVSSVIEHVVETSTPSIASITETANIVSNLVEPEIQSSALHSYASFSCDHDEVSQPTTSRNLSLASIKYKEEEDKGSQRDGQSVSEAIIMENMKQDAPEHHSIPEDDTETSLNESKFENSAMSEEYIHESSEKEPDPVSSAKTTTSTKTTATNITTSASSSSSLASIQQESVSVDLSERSSNEMLTSAKELDSSEAKESTKKPSTHELDTDDIELPSTQKSSLSEHISEIESERMTESTTSFSNNSKIVPDEDLYGEDSFDTEASSHSDTSEQRVITTDTIEQQVLNRYANKQFNEETPGDVSTSPKTLQPLESPTKDSFADVSNFHVALDRQIDVLEAALSPSTTQSIFSDTPNDNSVLLRPEPVSLHENDSFSQVEDMMQMSNQTENAIETVFQGLMNEYLQEMVNTIPLISNNMPLNYGDVNYATRLIDYTLADYDPNSRLDKHSDLQLPYLKQTHTQFGDPMFNELLIDVANEIIQNYLDKFRFSKGAMNLSSNNALSEISIYYLQAHTRQKLAEYVAYGSRSDEFIDDVIFEQVKSMERAYVPQLTPHSLVNHPKTSSPLTTLQSTITLNDTVDNAIDIIAEELVCELANELLLQHHY